MQAIAQTRTGKPIRCWIDEGIGKALDRYIADQRTAPVLTRVVELALREFLEREGYLSEPGRS